MKKISDLVLYKDHHIIAINKPSGLPSQRDQKGEKNAHQMLMAYAHRDLHVVHRLDQRVTGVLLFAKTVQAAAALQKNWDQNLKLYLGIVPVADLPSTGVMKHYLTYHQKSNMSQAHDVLIPGSDEAILKYRIIQHLDNFMVLLIELVTGRKHQIRAQLSAAGIPIRGDIKYGSKRTNADHAIDLHAYSLEFLHPTSGKKMKIVAPLPEGGLWEHVTTTDFNRID